MRRHLAYVIAVTAALSATVAWAVLHDVHAAAEVTAATRIGGEMLADEQQADVELPADPPQR